VLDLSGVVGGGTFPEKNAEQERPYLAAKSGKDHVYKAGRLKAQGAGRESEGFVVVLTTATKTPFERRSPALVALVAGGKCEGMSARTNYPSEKARKPWGELFVTAELPSTPSPFAPASSVGSY